MRIHFWSTAWQAHLDIIRSAVLFRHIVLGWVLALVVIAMALAWLLPPRGLGHFNTLTIALFPIELAAEAVMAIAWHRFIILGAAPTLAEIRQDGRHTLATYIALLGAMRLSTVGIGVLNDFVNRTIVVPADDGVHMGALLAAFGCVAMTVFMVYWAARLGLVLPAVAVGTPVTTAVVHSLSITRANEMPMMMAVVVFAVLYPLLTSMCEVSLGGTIVDRTILTAGVRAGWEATSTMVWVGFTALAFRQVSSSSA